MNKPSKLAAEVAGTLIVVSLLGTSAFADSRHREGTNSGQQQQSDRQRVQSSQDRVRRDAQSGGTYDRRGSQSTQSYDRQRSGGNRNFAQAPRTVQPTDRQRYDRSIERGQVNTPRQQFENRYSNNRGYNRGNDNRGYANRSYDNRGSQRYDSRVSSRVSYGSYPSRAGRSGMVMEGRISRINQERGGYRVWLDRGGYSYWVPEARFRLWPLRAGLSIRFGGWWNPLGYYDVYDMGPASGPFYTSGDLRGVVESVDYRRGTVVLRDDISGSFVTALLRGNDPRLGDLRPGDYVDLTGAWTRNGTFEAYQLQDVRQGDYGRNDDGYGY